jgi:hypothetical protein
MRTARHWMISACGLARMCALSLLACTPALAQQGEPIGSWWLVSDSTGAPSIMTPSTQGSGVIAFQCGPGRSTVVVGVNRPELRLGEAAGAARIEYQIGTGQRRRVEGRRVVGGVIELNEAASTEVIDAAAEAPFFAIHLPQEGAAEFTLVFRPVKTAQAIERLRKACRSAR